MAAALIATNRPGQALPPVTARNASQSAEENPAIRQKVQSQICRSFPQLGLFACPSCPACVSPSLTQRATGFQGCSGSADALL